MKALFVDRMKEELVEPDVARGVANVAMIDVTVEGGTRDEVVQDKVVPDEAVSEAGGDGRVLREIVAVEVIPSEVVLVRVVPARICVDDAVLTGWLATGHDGAPKPHGSKEQQPTKLLVAQSYQK